MKCSNAPRDKLVEAVLKVLRLYRIGSAPARSPGICQVCNCQLPYAFTVHNKNDGSTRDIPTTSDEGKKMILKHRDEDTFSYMQEDVMIFPVYSCEAACEVEDEARKLLQRESKRRSSDVAAREPVTKAIQTEAWGDF